MDREILFRGERTDNGEWIEGTYWQSNESIIDKQGYSIKITPETVGQYTGLTDKDGKKIFEGDIVKIEDDDGNTNFSDGGIGDVVFYRGIWYVSGEVHNGLYDLERNYYVSVIGNIHDNPELLEVE